MMVLDDAALDTLFRTARTHEAFSDQPVPDELLGELYDLLRLGPTSANCSPARFVFIRTAEGREKLRPLLSAGNMDKTMAAPVTVIVAQDSLFYQQLPQLYPPADAKGWFAGNPDFAEDTCARNSTLQGAYLIMAARALGLVCGPMSGFDKTRLDRVFFPSNSWKSNFLVNLGYPVPDVALPPRLPRLSFEEAAVLA